jgi:isoleucyl-tRNA synthetase
MTDTTEATTPFPRVGASPDFPAMEEEVLSLWTEGGTFEKSVTQREEAGAPDFVFYDGPPFATGLPHYGHLLTSYIKDTIPRFWAMRGHRVERRFGWDCHGLPVEMEVEKELELGTSQELEAYGIDRFNETCRSIVLRYTGEWEKTITRIGRWVDFAGGYKTMQRSFMESVWWVFQQLWEKGLVYEGHRVVPYSWRCATPLSNFEANLNYRDVQDPSVTVRMRALDEEGAYYLAWTTTPWTLPSNLALCVGPELDYVKVRDAETGDIYYLAEARLGAYWKDASGYEVLDRMKGSALGGRRYAPLLPYAAHLADEGAFRVVVDGYATAESGTGIVHQAPAFGEDDYRVCRREGIPFFDPVDADGRFTEDVSDFAGVMVKDADKGIIRKLKDDGSLVRQATIQHSYPFCWRTDTPLIYKAISAWYVNVEALKERLIANNREIRWVPDWVGDRRFGNWLEDARDWNISRNRYWGSCIPLWRCDAEGCDETVCIGSVSALADKSGVELTDLHKHHVDPVTWACAACGAGTMRRIPEVFDCWFESGSMPYGQAHYPFENSDWFEQNFPAKFIGEGLDQTRGWFYTLLVLSTALFDKPAFKNCVVNGLILASDGRKMSKREKNYTAPELLINRFGSDAVRFYMLSSPVVEGQNLRFVDDEVKELVKSLLLPLWNAYRFFTEYANADRWEPTGRVGEAAAGGAQAGGGRPETLAGTPAHALDRYILSELELTVQRVTREMESYRLVRACRAVREFLDTLNNWYIRRSRRRFWRTEDDSDKREAFETLFHVLVTYAKVLAPFAPFLAERVYRGLTGRESVHLADWPTPDASKIDEALSRDTAQVRKAISLAHMIRARARLKTRQPLGRVQVAGLTAAQVEGARELILEEVNAKQLEVIDDPATVASKVCRPDGRKLGPRLRGAVQEVIRRAKSGDFTELDGGNIQVGEHVLEPHEYEIAWQVQEGFDVEADGDLLVALDLHVDDALRREGLARDVVRQLQELRKDAGYLVSDRIEVYIEGLGEMQEAVHEHRDYIAGEVLATELLEDRDARAWDSTREVEIEEHHVFLGVHRSAG